MIIWRRVGLSGTLPIETCSFFLSFSMNLGREERGAGLEEASSLPCHVPVPGSFIQIGSSMQAMAPKMHV
jgi:hypothetical protein